VTRTIALWARRLVSSLSPSPVFDAAIGDLAEEYHLRSQSMSHLRATSWYWGQVVRSLPVMWCAAVRRDGWLVTIGVALLAWIAASALEAVADLALAAWLGSDAPLVAFPGFAIGLAAMACGGYLAGRMRPPAVAMLGAMVFIVVALLMIVDGHSAPLWYQMGFLLGGPLVSMAGGTCQKTLS